MVAMTVMMVVMTMMMAVVTTPAGCICQFLFVQFNAFRLILRVYVVLAVGANEGTEEIFHGVFPFMLAVKPMPASVTVSSHGKRVKQLQVVCNCQIRVHAYNFSLQELSLTLNTHSILLKREEKVATGSLLHSDVCHSR
jgi:hypothetical protein